MDLATAQAHLDAWLAADLNPATTVRTADGKSITYPTPEETRANIAYWQRVVLSYTAYAAGATGDISVRTPKWT